MFIFEKYREYSIKSDIRQARISTVADWDSMGRVKTETRGRAF